MTEEEIRNLQALVDTVSKKIEAQVKQGNTKQLKELLWNVPTIILKQYAKD